MTCFRTGATVAAALALACASGLSAQAMPGFTREGSAAQRDLEFHLARGAEPERTRAHSQVLTQRPHVAGTPEQQVTARYVLEQMAGHGLDTSRADLEVYIPYLDSSLVEIVGPTPRRLSLDEPALPSDSASQVAIWPAMAGLGGEGDATAPVVYVNYGLPGDYAVLDSLGVSVRGKVVIARFGRSYRGIKVREAERHGAVAILIYSDPADDGYAVGDIYPEGPMRPPFAVQRGSVRPLSGADPGSPDWPSLPGARRLPPEQMHLAGIPAIPIGYGNAEHILRPMRGRGAPPGWQGALPFRYHLGNDNVQVRVGVWLEPVGQRWKRVTNTFGTIRGTTWPDETVIIGGHRDAWGPGAVDNVSGVASILEAARLLGEAARAGQRPARTLVFATWDAEEWGIIGSSEWVEANAQDLAANAVAYLNLDASASGTSFGSSATASLHPLLRELTRLVAQPGDSGTVYDAWRRRTRPAAGADVRLGDLGGGSDFAGFYNHLGIPSAALGFGGPYGVYHSAYDSFDWMRQFGDTTFEAHAAAAALSALFLARMANAAIPPFDYVAFAGHLQDQASALASGRRSPRLDAASAKVLELSLARFAASARAWAQARDQDLAAVPASRLVAANAQLRAVERALTRPDGLASRPWFRNLVFAADRDNGYDNVALPSVAEALADGDQLRVRAEVEDLAQRIGTAAGHLDRGAGILQGR